MRFVDFLRWLPPYRKLEKTAAQLRADVNSLHADVAALRADIEQRKANDAEWARFSPPGHFYSPLPSREEIAEAFAHGSFGPPFGAIDLNEAGQFALLEKLAEFYPEQPFPEVPTSGRRYFFANPSFGHYDAIVLYGMMRLLRPRRIIEVGSGFSSAAMLDVSEHVLGRSVEFTFIDPDMSRLRPLLKLEDAMRCTLIERRVQEVPLETFSALGENDLLFIDSSHVSKIGSDVNRLFFDVLPVLAPGVVIHIHDVAGNLDYPRDWLEEGRAWNEQYLLRAFLMNNAAYRIELFTAWVSNQRHAFLQERMPLCARGGGGQMWLRKLAR